MWAHGVCSSWLDRGLRCRVRISECPVIGSGPVDACDGSFGWLIMCFELTRGRGWRSWRRRAGAVARAPFVDDDDDGGDSAIACGGGITHSLYRAFVVGRIDDVRARCVAFDRVRIDSIRFDSLAAGHLLIDLFIQSIDEWGRHR